MRTTFIITIALLLLQQHVHAQISFQRSYGSPMHMEIGHSVQQTADGGYVIAGIRDSIPSGVNQEIYLVKTDSLGDVQWEKTFENAQAYDVLTTNDGGYLITGMSHGWCSLLKTDGVGNEVWRRVYASYAATETLLSDTKQTPDGGYIVAGRTGVGAASIRDTIFVYILRVNTTGDTIWTKRYVTDPLLTSGVAIEPTDDGGYIITGAGVYTVLADSFSIDAYLMKIDSSGVTQWVKTYDFQQKLEVGHSVKQTADGGYVWCGQLASNVPQSTYPRAYTVRTDSAGNELWALELPYYSTASSVVQTGDGNFVVAGWMRADTMPNSRFFLYKVNDSGNIFWLKNYGVVGNDHLCSSMEPTTDGGFIMGGQNAYTQGDFLLVKVDADGNPFYTGIASPQAVSEMSSYPNPFSDFTCITLSNAARGTLAPLSLAVFDISGKQVELIPPVEDTGDAIRFIFQRKNLPAGAYIYRILQQNVTLATGKVLIY